MPFASAVIIYFKECFITFMFLSEVLLVIKEHSLQNLLKKNHVKQTVFHSFKKYIKSLYGEWNLHI